MYGQFNDPRKLRAGLFKTNMINLTSLLHHGEELVEKLFSLWVVVDLIQLQENKKIMFVTFLLDSLLVTIDMR